MSAFITLLGGRLKMYDHKPAPKETRIWAAHCVPICAGDTVLDVGCNTGIISLYLKLHVPDALITAIDIQAGFVEKTQQNAALNKLEGLTAHVANLATYVPAHLFNHVITELPDQGDLALWAKKCASFLQEDGTLTMLHLAAHTAQILPLFQDHTLTVYHLKTEENATAVAAILQVRLNHTPAHTIQTLQAYDTTLRKKVLAGGNF